MLQVLTAAHCVWDVDRGRFMDGLVFAPGRYRAANGSTVSPFGTARWSHVTMRATFKTSDAEVGHRSLRVTSSVTSRGGWRHLPWGLGDWVQWAAEGRHWWKLQHAFHGGCLGNSSQGRLHGDHAAVPWV